MIELLKTAERILLQKNNWILNATLFSIFSYMAYSNNVIWITFSILFALIGFRNIKTIALALGLTFLLIGIDVLFSHEVIKNSINNNYEVVEKTAIGPIIKVGKNNVLLQEYESVFNKGDVIKVTGQIEELKNTSGFNIEQYGKSFNVFSVIKKPELKSISLSENIVSKISKWSMEKTPIFNKYFHLLVLGDKTFMEKSNNNLLKQLNVVHLVVLSGFHITLLNKLLLKLFSFIAKDNYKVRVLISFMPLFYVALLSFQISMTRAFLMFFIVTLNKEILKNKYKRINILCFITIALVIWRPWVMYSYSFIFSFLLAMVIEFSKTIPFKTYLKKNIFIVVAINMFAMPLTISMNHYISVFGVMFSFVLTPIFSFMYGMSILLFWIPDVLSYFYYFLEWITTTMGSIAITIPVETTFSINFIYYFLIVVLFNIIDVWNSYTATKNTISIKL